MGHPISTGLHPSRIFSLLYYIEIWQDECDEVCKMQFVRINILNGLILCHNVCLKLFKLYIFLVAIDVKAIISLVELVELSLRLHFLIPNFFVNELRGSRISCKAT